MVYHLLQPSPKGRVLSRFGNCLKLWRSERSLSNRHDLFSMMAVGQWSHQYLISLVAVLGKDSKAYLDCLWWCNDGAYLANSHPWKAD